MKLALALAAIMATTNAYADRCVPLAAAKKMTSPAHGVWKPLSRDQWMFMRGAFTLWPHTAPGLPLGDKAFIVTSPKFETSLVFFVDGAMACDMLALPKTMREMLDQAALTKHDGDSTHEVEPRHEEEPKHEGESM